MIESAVPFLNNFRNPPKWPYTIDQHRAMERGTLGNEVARFLDGKELPLLPKYEVHDTIHVLAGYGTTPLEELKLQAFMIGNGSSTFPGKVLFLLGLMIKPEYTNVLRRELQRGQQARQLAGFDFAQLVLEDARSVRSRLRIA